jgi:hypothetical protein
LHVTGATGDQSLRIGSDALVAGLAVIIAVTVTLTPAKGIDRHGPRTVAFPIDQVRVVGRNVAGVDAIVRVGRMGSATAAKDRISRGVAVPLETDQIAQAIFMGIAISYAHSTLIEVAVVANVLQLFGVSGSRSQRGDGPRRWLWRY